MRRPRTREGDPGGGWGGGWGWGWAGAGEKGLREFRGGEPGRGAVRVVGQGPDGQLSRAWEQAAAALIIFSGGRWAPQERGARWGLGTLLQV